MARRPPKPRKPKNRRSVPRHKAKRKLTIELSKRISARSKRLLKELPSEAKMNRTIDRLAKYGHQATALMGAAYLEQALSAYLRIVFRPMDDDEEAQMFDGGRNGILSTFSSKIRIAYALGLLHRNPYHAMLLINDIRNVFAHSLYRVTFRNKLIAEDCKKLAGISDPLARALGLHPFETDDSLTIFSKMAQALYYSLRLSIQDWGSQRTALPPSPSTLARPFPPKDQAPHAGNGNQQ
jgi:hypothetical protein